MEIGGNLEFLNNKIVTLSEIMIFLKTSQRWDFKVGPLVCWTTDETWRTTCEKWSLLEKLLTESFLSSGPLSLISCWTPSARLSDSQCGSGFIYRGHGVLRSVLCGFGQRPEELGRAARGFCYYSWEKSTSCQRRLPRLHKSWHHSATVESVFVKRSPTALHASVWGFCCLL